MSLYPKGDRSQIFFYNKPIVILIKDFMLFPNQNTHVNKILWRNSDLVPGSQAKILKGLHYKNKK